jgi:hypothetical protein
MRRSGVSDERKLWSDVDSRPQDRAESDGLMIDLERAMPKLGPALIQRFESKEGYRTFDDVETCRKHWMTVVATNSHAARMKFTNKLSPS